jgi:DNA-binding transcriptional ArsR family regulator
MAVGELAAAVGLSQSALSQHLARMRDEGLVATRRQGQSIRYRIANLDVRRLLALLKSIYCP